MKKIKITRLVKPAYIKQYNQDELNDVEFYDIEYASKQGFITSLCDGEHYVMVDLVEV